MVLLATPGMLHGGLALKALKAWAGDPNNLVLIPGYCVRGTVGAMLIAGKRETEPAEYTAEVVDPTVQEKKRLKGGTDLLFPFLCLFLLCWKVRIRGLEVKTQKDSHLFSVKAC